MKASAVVLVVMLAAACEAPGRALTTWTRELPGDPNSNRVITLPLDPYADMPRRDTTYTLRSTVALSPAEQGSTLTLVIDCFHGRISASANGVALDNIGDRPVGEHRWVIPASATTGPTLDLAITAGWSNLEATGFGMAPRLAAGIVAGHAVVSTINRIIAIAGLSLLWVFILLYGAMYVMDRRRENLAVALGSLFCSVGPIWQLGLLPTLFGPFADSVPPLSVCLTDLAILYFLHDTFALGPPPRWIMRPIIGVALFNVVAPVSFTLTFVGNVLALCVTLPFLWHLVFRALWHPRGDRRRFDGLMLLASLFISALVMIPDLLGLFLGRSFLGGIHTISLGVMGFVEVMALLLARTHVSRQRQLERGAEELKRQVAERSRELADALGKLAQRPVDLTAERTVDDRYRIVRKLGAGGMGAVYEAVRISDGQRFALKTLRGRADHELMARFAREAQIAAEVSHPNLVPVLDVGISDGGLFLVMPLVEGGSLEHARKQFGDRQWALPVLRQIAQGLATLHARGIVHRDLKPANILMADGVARIADFGLAAFAVDVLGDTVANSSSLGDTAHSDTALAATAAPVSPLTRAGAVFGTPAYMAPELAAGTHDAQPSSDIFAFGVIAYELVIGKPAFAEPPLITRGAGREIPTPAALGDLPSLLARCLDLDPSKRPTAEELATVS